MSLLFLGCATHVPMSELVMFNQQRSVNQKGEVEYNSSGIGVEYSSFGPSEKKFDEKNEQNYIGTDPIGIENLVFSVVALEEDNLSFGFTLGGGSGFDVTSKIWKDYYGTLTVSMNKSAAIILQKRFLNEGRGGFSSGIFFGKGMKGYITDCRNCIQIGPSDYTSLYYTGIRSRFFFVERGANAPGFTGSINLGYALEIKEPFIGLSFAFLRF